MTGLTHSLAAHLRTLAGPDFTYPGVTGCGRPSAKHPSGGSPRKGLRAWLEVAQGGLCPQCGNDLDATTETCHVVSRGEALRGFIPGNVFAGHAACNASTKDVACLTPEHFVRPELVPTDWPVTTTGGFRVYA